MYFHAFQSMVSLMIYSRPVSLRNSQPMGHQGIIKNHLFYYPSIRPIKMKLNSEVKCAKMSQGQRATISVKITKNALTCVGTPEGTSKCTPRKSARKTEIVILTGIHLIATSFFVSLCSASFTSENAPLK